MNCRSILISKKLILNGSVFVKADKAASQHPDIDRSPGADKKSSEKDPADHIHLVKFEVNEVDFSCRKDAGGSQEDIVLTAFGIYFEEINFRDAVFFYEGINGAYFNFVFHSPAGFHSYKCPALSGSI